MLYFKAQIATLVGISEKLLLFETQHATFVEMSEKCYFLKLNLLHFWEYLKNVKLKLIMLLLFFYIVIASLNDLFKEFKAVLSILKLSLNILTYEVNIINFTNFR